MLDLDTPAAAGSEKTSEAPVMKPALATNPLQGCLQELQAKGRKLPYNTAIVMFHSLSGSDAKVLPLRDLGATALCRGSIRSYPNGKKEMPIMVGETVPVFADGTVHLGGRGWFSYVNDGITKFTKEMTELPAPNRRFRGDVYDWLVHCSIGQLYDVLCEERRMRVRFPLDHEHLDRVGKMLDFQQDNRITAREILAPKFVQPITSRKLYLRRGKELSEKLELCVRNNTWGIYNLITMAAPGRGKITVVSNDEIIFTYDDNGQSEVIRNPQEYVERRMTELFGCEERVDLFPIAPIGTKVSVRTSQTIFSPLGGKRELVKGQSVNVLEHLAAMTTIDDFGNLEVVDYALAYSQEEPMIHLGEAVQIQVISGAQNMRTEGPGFSIDLFNLAKRHQMHLTKAMRAEKVEVKLKPRPYEWRPNHQKSGQSRKPGNLPRALKLIEPKNADAKNQQKYVKELTEKVEVKELPVVLQNDVETQRQIDEARVMAEQEAAMCSKVSPPPDVTKPTKKRKVRDIESAAMAAKNKKPAKKKPAKKKKVE